MTPTSRQAPTLRSSRFIAVGLALLAANGIGCNSSESGGAGAGGSGTAGTGGATGAGAGGAQVGLGGSAAGGSIVTGTGGSGTGGAGGGAVGTGGAGAAGTGGATGAGTGGHVGTGGAGAGTGGAAASGGASGSGGQADAGSMSCPGETYNAASPPMALTLSGNLGAHDPAAYVLGSTIYLAATGLIAKTSTNLTTWTGAPSPLALPSWAATATGATNLWAPDISFFGGVYHLYYAASTFGSNKSCIGHATRAALDSGSWADQGSSVLCSNMGETDNWNAIDPNVVIDDDGTPWLEFGSFWSGLKMVKLTTAGARADTMLYSLANGANSRGSLEGGWVFKRCGYYYLFSSWGSCCTSPYDYNIRVGRSTTVTGPYVDMAGTSLMSGGGTLLVQGNSSWIAPGHNAVIVYNGKTYNMYHALQGSSSGPATLRISEIAWDANGWPVSGGP